MATPAFHRPLGRAGRAGPASGRLQEAPKRLPRGPKRLPGGSKRLPRAPKRAPRGPQGVPKGLGTPRDPQGVPKGAKGSPRAPQGVPTGRWNAGVAIKSAALRRCVRPVEISYTCNVYVYRGPEMTAPGVVRGSPGGRQGYARGTPGLRHPQNLLPTPKMCLHGDLLGRLGSNFCQFLQIQSDSLQFFGSRSDFRIDFCMIFPDF